MTRTQIAIFGGGCFWCTEAVFKNIKGVVSVIPGYTGGESQSPTYKQVCGGATGHAEVIKIEFDPSIISYKDLLTIFFASHDPTTLNRQGNDVGTQYRSIIFYTSPEQKTEAEKFIEELNKTEDGEKVVTQVEPLKTFYEAEEYHHNYFEKNPDKAYCQLVINPKLAKLKEKFSQLLSH